MTQPILASRPRHHHSHEYTTGLADNGFLDPTVVNGIGWRAELKPSAPTHLPDNGDREIVLHARNHISATRALNLIEASIPLYAAHPLISTGTFLAYSETDPSYTAFDREMLQLSRARLSAHGLWSGCRVAAKASRKTSWHYAVTKFAFSYSLYAAHIVDLDPMHRQYLAVSKLPADHIRFSHAIVAAYSALEDLGLELRASPAQPSRLKNGEWNPPVLMDLEKRLTEAGVNIAEHIVWTMRGPTRRLEARRPIPSRGKFAWTRGPVRDCQVSLVDAIAHTHWLRSKVASHSVKKLTTGLSPYDVTNVQLVVRKILLEVLDFWKELGRNPKLKREEVDTMRVKTH